MTENEIELITKTKIETFNYIFNMILNLSYDTNSQSDFAYKLGILMCEIHDEIIQDNRIMKLDI